MRAGIKGKTCTCLVVMHTVFAARCKRAIWLGLIQCSVAAGAEERLRDRISGLLPSHDRDVVIDTGFMGQILVDAGQVPSFTWV